MMNFEDLFRKQMGDEEFERRKMQAEQQNEQYQAMLISRYAGMLEYLNGALYGQVADCDSPTQAASTAAGFMMALCYYDPEVHAAFVQQMIENTQKDGINISADIKRCSQSLRLLLGMPAKDDLRL